MISTPPTSETHPSNLVGHRFGPFEAVALLGQGRLGTVYQGFNRAANSNVAIKVVHSHLATSPAWRKAFIGCAQHLQSLQLPGFAHVLAAGAAGGEQPYIVSEFVNGAPLRERLTPGVGLAENDALAVLLRVAEMLTAAHRAGLLHGALNPSNIFLEAVETGAPHVKLVDFGLAQLSLEGHAGEANIWQSQQPEYRSPEEMALAALDERTDLYALGLLGFELLSGRSPISLPQEATLNAAASKMLHQSNRQLSVRTSTLISRLLSSSPSARPLSAQAICIELKLILARPVLLPFIEALEPVDATPRPPPESNTRRRTLEFAFSVPPPKQALLEAATLDASITAVHVTEAEQLVVSRNFDQVALERLAFFERSFNFIGQALNIDNVKTLTVQGQHKGLVLHRSGVRLSICETDAHHDLALTAETLEDEGG